MSGLIDPADDGFAITPSDTEDLEVPTRYLYVGVAGNVKVDMLSGTTITWVTLAAGVLHQLQVRKVYSTGTAATSIIGIP